MLLSVDKTEVFRDCSLNWLWDSQSYNAGLAFSSAVMLSFRNGNMVMGRPLLFGPDNANHGPEAPLHGGPWRRGA
jgi:hypothetical protein